MFNHFSEVKVVVHFEPIGSVNPDLVIFTTESMRTMFIKYGACTCFDLTYNLVRDSSDRAREYRVGFFVGLNGNNKIVPFAMVVTDSEDK